jgi:hypothetical protein
MLRADDTLLPSEAAIREIRARALGPTALRLPSRGISAVDCFCAVRFQQVQHRGGDRFSI